MGRSRGTTSTTTTRATTIFFLPRTVRIGTVVVSIWIWVLVMEGIHLSELLLRPNDSSTTTTTMTTLAVPPPPNHHHPIPLEFLGGRKASSVVIGPTFKNQTTVDLPNDQQANSSSPSRRVGSEEAAVMKSSESRTLSSSSSLSPSLETQTLSPVCRPFFHQQQQYSTNHSTNEGTPTTITASTTTRITRIVFAHMRKAGGTTLRGYLKRVANQYQLDFSVKEGYGYEKPQQRRDTLYVTHVRDPIARTISHFQYEGRWPCTTLKNQSFVPTQENAVDFVTWIYSDVAHVNQCTRRPRPIWKCSENCYTRWLALPYYLCGPEEEEKEEEEESGGEDTEEESPDSQEEEEEEEEEGVDDDGTSRTTESFLVARARKMAWKYNLIVDTAQLHDHHYARNIERFFGRVPGLVNTKFRMHCEEYTKAANRMVPLVYDNSTLNLLQARNQLDYPLYKDLVTCPNGIHFPTQTLADFVGDE